jgi:hypothetical protein
MNVDAGKALCGSPGQKLLLCFDLKRSCLCLLEVREGVERWVEEEEKENNATLE